MTVIVGIVEGDRVVMGGDSLGCSGYDCTSRKDAKVFRNGEFIMGFTSSYRMGQLLRYSFSPPALREGQDVFEYMVNDFVGAVRECLRHGGYARNEQGEESGGTFLVGFRGRLFEIQTDFQVCEPAGGISAIGCGGDYALGALWTAKGLDALQQVEEALEAAEHFSTGCRGPFTILETEPGGGT